MLLESLKQFDWMNEPANVRFDEKGMNVIAKYRTDFWCCARYDFRKDDGHFFFSYVLGDFCCDLNWEFGDAGLFNQCGIMLRTDVNNWFKCSIMYEKEDSPLLATSLTVDGYSDLATIPLPAGVKRVWYRADYIQLRKFYLVHEVDDVKVGAYICSPQKEDFTATLHEIKLY